MKRILLIIAALAIPWAVLPQQPQTPPAAQAPLTADAGIEGVVVRFGSNETLSKAAVELVLAGVGTVSTTTEADGRFYFPNLQPGSYRLYSRRDGHWPAEYGQRWVDGPGQAITIAPGQQWRGVQIVMTPGGVIAGRVTDRNGLPMAGARIRAMKPWIQENQRQLRVVQEVVANDLGEYRLIWLMPGRYYISATFVDYTPAAAASQLVIDPDAANGLANGTRSASRPVTSRALPNGLEDNEVYTPIYFPATLDSDKALAIELKQGEEYRGADIHVLPVRTFHVRGVVTNPPPPATAGAGQPPAPVRGQPPGGLPPAPGAAGRGRGGTPVRLAPLSPNGSLYNTGSDADTGRFDFPKVVAGSYVAYVFTNGLTVRSTVDVRNGDVDGVALNITSGIDIPVNVTFEGTLPPNLPNLAYLNVTLWRNPTLLSAPSMPATAGTPLTLKNIAPGDYHIYVLPLLGPLQGANPLNPPQPAWQGIYVKSMRLGDVDVLNGGLKLNRPPDETLDIVIGGNPGILDGVVVNDRNDPVPGAVVTLFANVPADRLYRSDMYKVTSTDLAGRFRADRLPPGEYKVFAWENIEKGAWIDSTFLRQYEDRGQTIHIDEGKTLSGSLPVVSLR